MPGNIYSSLHHGNVILPGKEVNTLKIAAGENAGIVSEQMQTDRSPGYQDLLFVALPRKLDL